MVSNIMENHVQELCVAASRVGVMNDKEGDKPTAKNKREKKKKKLEQRDGG
uniref:Uncharacterized protein n=1 Tax=Oryza sativa subsp. japonica TaxID=39947 RepID=Q6ZJN3_ORYSJ|nr:hypothetical protein [Oryza sativa Japonica Group]